MLPRHKVSFYGPNKAGEVWVAREEQSMERRSKAWKGIKSDIMRFWLCLAKTPIFDYVGLASGGCQRLLGAGNPFQHTRAAIRDVTQPCHQRGLVDGRHLH